MSRKIEIQFWKQREYKMTAEERDADLKRHRRNALIKEGSCGNEPGDAVPDSMRNSQDGSFHYSGRSEVSLPQVDLEPTRRDHRLSPDGRMWMYSTQEHALYARVTLARAASGSTRKYPEIPILSRHEIIFAI